MQGAQCAGGGAGGVQGAAGLLTLPSEEHRRQKPSPSSGACGFSTHLPAVREAGQGRRGGGGISAAALVRRRVGGPGAASAGGGSGGPAACAASCLRQLQDDRGSRLRPRLTSEQKQGQRHAERSPHAGCGAPGTCKWGDEAWRQGENSAGVPRAARKGMGVSAAGRHHATTSVAAAHSLVGRALRCRAAIVAVVSSTSGSGPVPQAGCCLQRAGSASASGSRGGAAPLPTGGGAAAPACAIELACHVLHCNFTQTLQPHSANNPANGFSAAVTAVAKRGCRCCTLRRHWRRALDLLTQRPCCKGQLQLI